MEKVFFEGIHNATRDYPYIDLTMKNVNYISHYHNEIELIYIIEGKTILTVNGEEQPLNKNDIYIVMPGKIHSFHSEGENNMYIMKIYAPHELSCHKINGFISANSCVHDEIKDIINAIALEDSGRQRGYRFAVNKQINELFIVMMRKLHAQQISDYELKSSNKRISFLGTVNSYLEQHYTEKILLDDICAHTHYSKYYFSHFFKSVTNISFVEYLTAFRLEKAKLLLNSDKNITEIALDCGFNTLRSFNRCFKQYHLTTPMKYKAALQQEVQQI